MYVILITIITKLFWFTFLVFLTVSFFDNHNKEYNNVKDNFYLGTVCRVIVRIIERFFNINNEEN